MRILIEFHQKHVHRFRLIVIEMVTCFANKKLEMYKSRNYLSNNSYYIIIYANRMHKKVEKNA